jgi:hypothetical protein
MLRTARWPALLTTALLASWASAGEPEVTQASTILGPLNQLLSDGSAALEAGRYEEGVRLTLAGLEAPNNKHDEASGHTNICAGYAALKKLSHIAIVPSSSTAPTGAPITIARRFWWG